MAKQLLLHVLTNVVGKYVEGLTEENLQVGLWNGTVELHNLAVRSSALDGLHLPIKIDRAVVKSLKLTIPWASLTSKSIVIEIDGILVQASPLDISTTSVEEAKAALIAAKKSKLYSVESAILAQLQPSADFQETVKQASYVQAMVTKIIDNLEVKISNIHVRYEDNLSLRHSSFACGVTLLQISLSTTDKNWQKCFVDSERDDQEKGTSFKLGCIHQLGIYWNSSSCQLSGHKTATEWSQYMLALIRCSSSPPQPSTRAGDVCGQNDTEPMHYLLSPQTAFSVRLINRKSNTTTLPKIDIEMQSSALQFQLNETQYGQIKSLQQVFHDMEYRRVMITFRPTKSPIEDPRAWWRYAYLCVTGKETHVISKIEAIAISSRVRDIYLPHCKRTFVFDAIKSDLKAGGCLDPRGADTLQVTETVKQKIINLEAEVDLTTLTTYRIMAAHYAVAEVRQLRADSEKMRKYLVRSGLAPQGPGASDETIHRPSQTEGGGWLGWWNSGNKTQISGDAPAEGCGLKENEENSLDNEDQQLMDDIKLLMIEADLNAKAEAEKDYGFLFRMRLSTSADLVMILRSHSMVSLKVDMRAYAAKKGNSFNLALQLGDVSVEDLVTVCPINKNIIAALPEVTAESDTNALSTSSFDSFTIRDSVLDGKVPQVRLDFSLRDGTTTVDMVAMPLLVIFNEKCVHALVSFLATSPPKTTYISYSMAARSPLLIENMKKFSTNMALPAGRTDVNLVVHSPKFMIPEKSDNADMSCLFLDTGKLEVDGSLGPSGMKWDIVLNGVNVQLFESMDILKQRYVQLNPDKVNIHSKNYLLTPFSLHLDAQSIDKTKAELQIDGKVAPGVSARMNVNQLFQVLRIIDNVTVAAMIDPEINIDERRLSRAQSPRSFSNDKDPAMPVDKDMQVEAVQLMLLLQLPSLTLVFEIDESRELRLILDDVSFDFVKRVFDTTVQFQVNGMSLSDSCRSQLYEHLVYTSEVSENEDFYQLNHEWAGDQHKLLSATYRLISCPLSPLFDSNQSEVSVLSSGITVVLDEATIDNFLTVAQQISKENKVFQSSRKLHTPQENDDGNEASSSVTAEQSTKFGDSIIRMHVIRTALILLHAPDKHRMFPVNAHEVESPKQLHLMSPGQCIMSKAFEFVISKVSGRVFIPYGNSKALSDERISQGGNVMCITASAENIEILDCRTSCDGISRVHNRLLYSRNLCRRDSVDSMLFSPRSDNSMLGWMQSVDSFSGNDFSGSPPSATPPKFSESSAAGRIRFNSLAQSITSFRTALSATRKSITSKHFLKLSLTQNVDTGDKCIEVSLNNVAAPISTEAVQSLWNLISQNIDAASRVGAVFSADEEKLSKSPATKPIAEVQKVNTGNSPVGKININLRILNPLLLLLEDPCAMNSSAIGIELGIRVDYLQESLVVDTPEQHRDKKRLSAETRSEATVRFNAANIFLTNMSHLGVNRFLLEPFDAEFRYSSVAEDLGSPKVEMKVSAPQAIEFDLSLRSIMLTSKIIHTATCKPFSPKSEGSPDDRKAASLSPQDSFGDNGGDGAGEVSGPRHMNGDDHNRPPAKQICQISINMPSIRFTVADDTQGQNIPLVFIEVGDVSFSACDGLMETNSGSFILARFFNLYNNSWEPVVEKWYPQVRYCPEDAGNRLSLVAISELRINISGAFLSRIHRSLEAMEKVYDSFTEFLAPETPFQIQNNLGVPIKIADSKTKRMILTLDGETPAVVPPLQNKREIDHRSFVAMRNMIFPDLFDIHLMGHLSEQRLPILQVPASSNHPRHYFFKLNPSYHGASFHRPTKRLPSQPIVEEVIENSRYNRLTFQWGDPYTSLGDPARWTDRKLNALPFGNGTLPDNEVPPPPGWGWVESNWSVDMGMGKVGEEIDAAGWEYASRGFYVFTSSRQHRTQRPLDSVRRRRWIRSRYPIALSNVPEEESTLQKPLPVSWHVEVMNDETRVARISSGVLFTNNTEMAIELDMVESILANVDKEIDMVVDSNSTSAVPIFLAAGSSFRIRPQCKMTDERGGNFRSFSYTWSEPVAYRRKFNENAKSFSDNFQLSCNCENGGVFRAVISLLYADGIFRLTCSSCAEIYNRLPCILRCHTMGAGASSGQEIRAGAMMKLSCVDFGRQEGLKLVLQVSEYEGHFHIDRDMLSNMEDSDGDGEREEENAVLLTGRGHSPHDGGETLALTILIRTSLHNVVQILIFSKYLLVDKTNMSAAVSSSYVDARSQRKVKVLRRAGAGSLEESVLSDLMTTMKSNESNTNDNDYAVMWTGGCCGMTFFQPSKTGHISFSVKNDEAWFDDLSLDTVGSNKTAVNLLCEKEERCYHVALKTSALSGAFSFTKVLTIMPAIMIVNCLDQTIELLQVSKSGNGPADGSFSVPSGGSRAWVSDTDKAPTTVRLSTAFSGITLGSVDLNEIGSTQLVLPRKHRDRFDCNSGLMIVNVEVKFSQPTESSYITVVIWQAVIDRNPDGSVDTSTVTLSIRNQTNLPLVVRQHVGIEGISASSDDDVKAYDLRLMPGQWLPYGWRDPDAGQSLWVAIGTTHKLSMVPVCEFDLLKSIGKTLTVPLPIICTKNGRGDDIQLDDETRAKVADLQHGDIRLKVEVLGNGFDVRIFNVQGGGEVSLPLGSLREQNSMKIGAMAYARSPDLQGTTYFIFEVELSWISVSVIAESPKRRELLCVHLDTIEVLYMRLIDSFNYHEEISEFKIHNFQIDNFSESLLSQVLLHSYDRREEADTERMKRKKIHLKHEQSVNSVTSSWDEGENDNSCGNKSADDSLLPFLQIAFTKAKPVVDDASLLKSLSVRLLELHLNVDSSTIILLFLDLLPDLTGVSTHTNIYECSLISESYIAKHNEAIFRAQLAGTGDAVLEAVSVYNSMLSERKHFIEELTLHPIKIKVRFMVSTFPRRTLKAELRRQHGLSWLSALQRATAIDGALIKLNSLSTHNAMLTLPQMIRMIIERTVDGLRHNIGALVGSVFGSMKVLGKPAGLYKKLGSGVQDFFYEPYQGAMQSPTKFLVGIGKGSTAFATEVTSGLVSSAASIVGSVSGGVSGVVKAALVGDEQYLAKRAERRRLEHLENKGIGSGFRSGASNVIEGFASGLKGIVTAPIEHGRKGGALGFVKGVGVGLIGAAVKPALGLSDGVTVVAAGFNKSADDRDERNWFRPPRAFERVPHNFDLLLLVEFENLFAAYAQQVITDRCHDFKTKDHYEASVVLSTAIERSFKHQSMKTLRTSATRDVTEDVPYGLAISHHRIFILNAHFSVLREVPFATISHVNLTRAEHGGSFIEMVLYDMDSTQEQKNKKNNLLLPCGAGLDGDNAFRVLLQFAHRMGNPSECMNMNRKAHSASGRLAIDDADHAVTCSDDETSFGAPSREESNDDADEYRFGSIYNSSAVTKERGNNVEIIQRARERFTAVPFGFDYNNSTQTLGIADTSVLDFNSTLDSINIGLVMNESVQPLSRIEYYNTMDRLVWLLIADWKNNHGFLLNPSRCAACLIINESRNPVQITEVNLREGVDYNFLSVGAGYNDVAQTLIPRGGAVVVFAFGRKISILDLAHVRLQIFSTACVVNINTRAVGASCRSKDGWNASFREKTARDMWNKSVIIIDDSCF